MRAFLTSRDGPDWALYFHFSCAGFSLWHRLSLVVARRASLVAAWTLVVARRVRRCRLGSCRTWAHLLPGMWHLSSLTRIKPACPAL